MPADELFCRDLTPSSRDWFKVSLSYIKLGEARKKKPELGFVSIIVNVPSRYLAQRREEYVVKKSFQIIGNHTGFIFDGTSAQKSEILRKSYSIEACYILEDRRDPSIKRSWTGSTKLRGTAEPAQTAGVLQEFEELLRPGQLVVALRDFNDSRTIADKIIGVFDGVNTDWMYSGCVSLAVLIQLKGYFPEAYRPRHVTEVIDADE